LLAGPVVHCEEKDDHAAGGEAARVTETLDKEYVRAVASRSDGRSEPGGAATDDEDVRTGDDRNLSLRDG
jgi:hypothetical protein